MTATANEIFRYSDLSPPPSPPVYITVANSIPEWSQSGLSSDPNLRLKLHKNSSQSSSRFYEV